MGPSSPWCAGHVDLPRGPPRSLPHAQQGPSPPHPWAPRAPPAHTTSRLSPLLLRSVLRPLRDTGTPLTNEAMEPSSRGITELSYKLTARGSCSWSGTDSKHSFLRAPVPLCRFLSVHVALHPKTPGLLSDQSSPTRVHLLIKLSDVRQEREC
ncbi:unnamed protein product [Rangifer tarandus platyrhynchus]|uniref:Uncharacterized protein n=1 Tax=Rangifer tarandus platyrhynchus TaxID=3082113 RepID=A0ABN8YHD2_RANTA|nr:unnamed protein product [Rangifer tarandus platyrhynchus]